MSHITEFVIQILMNRAHSRIRLGIGQEQYGFIRSMNAIFMLWMISESAIKMQKHVYFCFIAYAKIFDKSTWQKTVGNVR